MRAEGTPADRGGGSSDEDDEALLAALAHQAGAFGTPLSLGPSQQAPASQPGPAQPELGSQLQGSPSASQQVRPRAGRLLRTCRRASCAFAATCSLVLLLFIFQLHRHQPRPPSTLPPVAFQPLAAPQEAALARAESAQLRLLQAARRECEDILACSQLLGEGAGEGQAGEGDTARQQEPLLQPQEGQPQCGGTAGPALATAHSVQPPHPWQAGTGGLAGDIEDLPRRLGGQGGMPEQQAQRAQQPQDEGHEEHEEDAVFLQAMEDFEQRQQAQQQAQDHRAGPAQPPPAPSIPQTDGQWDLPCSGTQASQPSGRRKQRRLPQVDGSGDAIESDSGDEEASQVSSAHQRALHALRPSWAELVCVEADGSACACCWC